jgi:hypothetical protein
MMADLPGHGQQAGLGDFNGTGSKEAGHDGGLEMWWLDCYTTIMIEWNMNNRFCQPTQKVSGNDNLDGKSNGLII